MHFAFLPEHSDTYLIQMLILREHYSPTKAMCEVKLFMHLHKNICLIKLMAFVAYMCECVYVCVCVRGVSVFRKW